MDGRISNFAQIASVRRYTVTDGKGVGLSVIDCDNGKMRFLLNVSKALDVMQLYHKGQNVSFLSKNAFVASEKSFLSRFEGGMIYTCGLDSVGGREGYELHGLFHNNPAEVTHVSCGEDGIVVEATVHQTTLFGDNLVMRRRISSAIGSDTFTVEDTLSNEGHKDARYALLYHVNLGYPMLDDGCVIDAEVIGCDARSPWAQKNKATHKEMSAPTADGEEMCYYLSLGKPEISLVNSKLSKRFTLSYSGDTLTELMEWKSMVSGDYALGLEPATTRLDDGFAERTLSPQESVSFRLSLSVVEIK